MTAAILAGSFPGRSWRKARPLPCKNGGRLVLFRGKKACPLVSDMKRKRPNFDTFVPPTVTLSVAARTSGGDRNQLRKGIIRPLLEDSVYGHILQKCPIQFTNGEAYEWEYINPFAVIHQYTSARPRFGDMLRGAGSVRIAFYMDETTPGNVLRPDHGRSLACFYWTLMELPSWFRSRHCGWFYFGLFPLSLVEHVAGGYSFLFAFMVKTFFGKGLLAWDFDRTGICCKSSGGDFILKARFGALLSDEKAMKELWCTKGASSYKPCHLCKNVMGRVDLPDRGYLVHYTCTDSSRFDLHTADSFRTMAQNLKLEAGNLSKKDFERLEQSYGLVFDPLGILWCEDLGGIVNPVSHTYWDWMHILMACGGIAQYEFNQYARRLCSAGVSLRALDDLAAEIVWPKGAYWSKKYFQKRVVDKDGAHLKAFANELFQLTDIWRLILQLVVRPAGILELETRSLESMMKIIDILSMQEEALPLVGDLEIEIAQHHAWFLELYPDCNKPKTHWLRHVPSLFREFGCNLSCFSPEKKHKGVKQLALLISANVEKGVLYRAVAENFSSFSNDENMLRPIFLERAQDMEAEWLRAFYPDMQEAKVSKTLRFEGGRVSASDMLWFPATKHLAQASFFLQVRLLNSSEFLIHGDLYQQVRDSNTFRSTGVARLFVCTKDMVPISFCKRNGGICPCVRLAHTN